MPWIWFFWSSKYGNRGSRGPKTSKRNIELGFLLRAYVVHVMYSDDHFLSPWQKRNDRGCVIKAQIDHFSLFCWTSSARGAGFSTIWKPKFVKMAREFVVVIMWRNVDMKPSLKRCNLTEFAIKSTVASFSEAWGQFWGCLVNQEKSHAFGQLTN